MKLINGNSITTFIRTMSEIKTKCSDSVQKAQLKRRLVAFDFDYTIVGQNTDTIVRDILPPAKQPSSSLIETDGWTEYMAAVFRQLHQEKVLPEQIRDAIRGIPEVPGFVRLIKRLHQDHQCDMIIISDSNSIFIDEWLRSHGGLDKLFKAVFTNPGRFSEPDEPEPGLLTIKPYHHQTDCQLSAPNLCKGRIFHHFLVEQDLRHNLRYDTLIYVGDGSNDICPVLRCLRDWRDYACARHGFALEKTLLKKAAKQKNFPQIVSWDSGFGLLESLEEHFRAEVIG